MIGTLQRPLQSQTWSELKILLRELSPDRRRFLSVVLICSFFQGLLDIFLVGLLARLVGLLAGARLSDQIPGIRFFGGDFLDQAGWIVGLLAGKEAHKYSIAASTLRRDLSDGYVFFEYAPRAASTHFEEKPRC